MISIICNAVALYLDIRLWLGADELTELLIPNMGNLRAVGICLIFGIVALVKGMDYWGEWKDGVTKGERLFAAVVWLLIVAVLAANGAWLVAILVQLLPPMSLASSILSVAIPIAIILILFKTETEHGINTIVGEENEEKTEWVEESNNWFMFICYLVAVYVLTGLYSNLAETGDINPNNMFLSLPGVICSLFAVKSPGGYIRTGISNLSQWPIIGKVVLGLFVLCIIMDIRAMLKYAHRVSKSKQVPLWLLGQGCMVFLVRQVIKGLFPLRDVFPYIWGIIEIIAGFGMVLWGIFILFAPLFKKPVFYIPKSTHSRSDDWDDEDDRFAHITVEDDDTIEWQEPEKTNFTPDDLPGWISNGGENFTKVTSYGWGVLYRSTSDSSHEIVIKSVYFMTSSEAGTDQGHFWF